MQNKIKLPKGWELKRLEDGLYEVIHKYEELEIGKDYIHNDEGYLVIDRIGDEGNSGFTHNGERFNRKLVCSDLKEWREATEEEVVKFFERHLIKRYGEDWRNVKIKECMSQDDEYANVGLNSVDIDKYGDSWMVWNNNGCLFNGKEWAEFLEETKYAEKLEDIDRPYYISSIGYTIKSTFMQTKNHMTSKELCEGILALQQLISFRDDFHEVHGGVDKSKIRTAILFKDEVKFINTNSYNELFEFTTENQAKEFYETHKELFKELKKLY